MFCVFGTSSEIQLSELLTVRLLGPCPSAVVPALMGGAYTGQFVTLDTVSGYGGLIG